MYAIRSYYDVLETDRGGDVHAGVPFEIVAHLDLKTHQRHHEEQASAGATTELRIGEAIRRVERRADVPSELVVVDDRGPDPALSQLLDRLRELGLITLLRNDRNEGFVTSVNRGMDLHADRNNFV